MVNASSPPTAGLHPRGPLDGHVVLDLSRALAGPQAGMMLGDLGARVIKVESRTGDETRAWGPPFVDTPSGPISTYFLSCNRNKQSIALDLKDADDAALLRRMIVKADVLIENFRTGVMDRLGLSMSALLELNPRLVILSITGFGHDGPESGRAGYDQIAQGETGLMSMTGSGPGDPQRVGVPITDLLSGVNGVCGVLASLLERDRTGKGGAVRTSLLAAGVGLHAFQATRYLVAGEIPEPNGNHHPSISPYGAFACRDGIVQLSVANDRLWRTFATEFGIDPDRADLATNDQRVRNRDVATATVERAFAELDAADLMQRLTHAGIPAGLVRSLDEVYGWDQVHAQRLVVDVDHPELGEISLPGSPLRFFAAEAGTLTERTRLRHEPPPLLDADRIDVRRWAET